MLYKIMVVFEVHKPAKKARKGLKRTVKSKRLRKKFLKKTPKSKIKNNKALKNDAPKYNKFLDPVESTVDAIKKDKCLSPTAASIVLNDRDIHFITVFKNDFPTNKKTTKKIIKTTKRRRKKRKKVFKVRKAICITKTRFSRKYKELKRKLGEGGFGKVFRGVRKDGLPVAIKKIPKKFSGNLVEFQGNQVPQEFVHQYLASQISKTVVKPLDFSKDRENFILVMERNCQSICLHDYINKKNKIPMDEIKHIFLQILSSIEKLHEGKIIHRDIKAENILINKSTKEVKLIDFGCAANDQAEDFTQLCGTEQQFPPEYFTSKRYRGRTLDLWCLGQVLYFLVEKLYPFDSTEDIVRCRPAYGRARGKVRDLLTRMLHEKEEARPGAEEIRRHPFLAKSSCSFQSEIF